jgi:YegS/Rv2252/BmrU family lipid kinase
VLHDSYSPLIVVNKFAARWQRVWNRIKGPLEQNNVTYEVFATSKTGEAEFVVRKALRNGRRIVAAVGGDGTLSGVIRGFFESPTSACVPPAPVNPSAALAILPAGTADDFARGMTGYRAPIEQWVKKLIAHSKSEDGAETSRLIDALYVTVNDGARCFVCLNATTLGVSADVVAQMARQRGWVRHLSGEARFFWAAIRSLRAWRNHAARIIVDEEAIECETNLLAVVNGQYVGGGMKIVPSAIPDDGFLDLITACGITRMQAVRELPRIYRAGHLANPKVILRRGTRARVETVNSADTLSVEADGDLRGQTPADFRLMKSALRLVW